MGRLVRQITPVRIVRARAPRTRSHAKCAHERTFRARFVRLHVIMRPERARGNARRERFAQTLYQPAAHTGLLKRTAEDRFTVRREAPRGGLGAPELVQH